PETSIGIDEVRSLQNFLSKKPSGGKKNIVILHDAHLLTLPAQQAILKTLEEPPGDSQIYLVTSQPDSLLPTILSRCQIISPQHTTYMSNATYMSYIEKLLSSSSAGERLEILDSANFDRRSALDFLNQFELYLHSQVILRAAKDPEKIYNLISQARIYLKSNCSLRLILNYLATQFTHL
ncbi:MAG: hypothetical protein AAB909_03910, partial [Patescibacteria group bacterium]